MRSKSILLYKVEDFSYEKLSSVPDLKIIRAGEKRSRLFFTVSYKDIKKEFENIFEDTLNFFEELKNIAHATCNIIYFPKEKVLIFEGRDILKWERLAKKLNIDTEKNFLLENCYSLLLSKKKPSVFKEITLSYPVEEDLIQRIDCSIRLDGKEISDKFYLEHISTSDKMSSCNLLIQNSILEINEKNKLILNFVNGSVEESLISVIKGLNNLGLITA